MSNDKNIPTREEVDEATAQRLSQLRSMPVDLSGIDRRIKAMIPQELQSSQTQPHRWRLFSPMRIAAMVAMVIGIAAVLTALTWNSAAIASPAELLRIHNEVVSGVSHATRVASIDEASRVLREQLQRDPGLPDVPDARVMACCMHKMGNKTLACVTLSLDDQPVTMTVAAAGDIEMPRTTIVEHNGKDFHVHTLDGVNMVMTNVSGHWVCVMGKVDQSKLIDLGASLRF
jgi:hypothetical protein